MINDSRVLFVFFLRAPIPNSSTEDETTRFLAKQEIVWKGFLNMLTVAKFVTKGYLVSGSAENLKAVKSFKKVALLNFMKQYYP